MRSEAAGGGMLVREDEPPGSQAEGCLLVFHSYGSDGHLIRPDRFEKALALLSGSLAALNGWGIDARWVADFTDWEETEVKTRVQLARTREKLISAERSSGTEAHDLIQAFSTARDSECVIIISDMAKETWEAFVPKFHLVPVILDITRYDGAAKLGKRGRR
jgi:hypothetical protein